MKLGLAVTVYLLAPALVQAEVNAVITDGRAPFAEGVLTGYVVQARGRAVCKNPYAVGRYISCKNEVTVGGTKYRAPREKPVWADTNGVLGAMIVIDSKGNEICKNPVVYNQFRGSSSFIACED